MAFVTAKPLQVPDDYGPKEITEERKEQIKTERQRAIKMIQRRREGTKPKPPDRPSDWPEPTWDAKYCCFEVDIGKNNNQVWDETTAKWISRNLYAQCQYRSPREV